MNSGTTMPTNLLEWSQRPQRSATSLPGVDVLRPFYDELSM